MDENNTNFAPDTYEPDLNDMILPDDFDPNNENYDLEAGLTESAPEANTPTTEQTPTETDPAVPEPQTETQPEPTTTPAQPEQPSTTAVPPTTPVGQPQEPVAMQVPQTIKVKFNHEERDLTLDEAAILAQKGMNYDKLQQRFADLEARSTKSEALARQLGYKSADEMLEAAGKNFVDKQVQELVDAGNTEAMARFLVEQQMAKAAASVPKTPEPEVEQAPAKTEVIAPERRAELLEFVHAYPDASREPLPQEVIDANKSGVRLLVAYERYLNKAALKARDEALKELAILKQNQEAAAKAPVSGVTGKAVATKTQEEDPYLKGFDSDDW